MSSYEKSETRREEHRESASGMGGAGAGAPAGGLAGTGTTPMTTAAGGVASSECLTAAAALYGAGRHSCACQWLQAWCGGTWPLPPP